MTESQNMRIAIDKVTAIENRYTDDGAPSLGEAYDFLLRLWEQGEGNREVCLRLLFLSWYSCSEPNVLTGLPDGSMAPLFNAIFDHLGGEQTGDPETLLTVGVMASSFPWCCGDGDAWKAIGHSLMHRYDCLESARKLGPSHFQDRGAYGSYFAHMLTTES